MPYVDLSRRFSKWRDENARSDDFALFERGLSGNAAWEELLKYQRVIVLAEAGSGKSKELEEQAKKLVADGQAAFHATVQNVAKEGLDGALDAPSRARLEAWRQSEETGYFFIDSVDEAKLDDIRFVDALRKLSDGLGSGLSRARIIISGRYSRWEFKADLERLNEVLPVVQQAESEQTKPEELLSKILRNEVRKQAKEPKVEKPLVVLMAALEQDQVRKFAEGQGVEKLDDFMAAIAHDNLWHFARRPLDLGWLVDYWQKNRRFGRFAEILEASIRTRLREEDPERGSRDVIDVERAMAAMERIGATMVFGRADRIEIPDSGITLGSSNALKLRDILPDWPPEQLPILLTRPVFDPASLGQVRLHNDNEGVVRGYLAARWLKARLEAGTQRSRVFALLFGDADGTPIVLPSAKETAAWLSAWNDDVAREVIARDPTLLLTAGDPTSLSSATRQAALRAAFKELASGITRHPRLDHDTLRRFSTDDVAPALEEGWAAHGDSKEVRRLILNMIDAGGLAGGLPLARKALGGDYDDSTTIVLGVRAMGSIGDKDDLSELAAKVRAEAGTADPSIVWEALEALFPDHLSVEGFAEVLAAVSVDEDRSDQFGWRGKRLVERVKARSDYAQLLDKLLALLGEPPDEDDPEEGGEREKRLKPLLQAAATGLLKLTPRRALPEKIVEAAIRLSGDRFGGRRFEDEEFQPLLLASPERRREGLWRAVEVLKDHPRLLRVGLTGLWQLDLVGWHSGIREEDIDWLLEDANDGDTPLKRRLALSALMPLWRDTGKSDELLSKITEAAEKAQETRGLVDAWLTPPTVTPDQLEHEKEMQRLKQKRERENKKRDESWVTFIDELKANPEALRKPPADLKPGNIDGRLFYLWELLYAATEERTGYAIDDFGALEHILGPDVTREATEALIKFWRRHTPTLTSSRDPDKRNMTSKIDSMGIAGIALEARRDKSWASELTSSEATTAAQLATQELNGYPHWLAQLAGAWPDEVRVVFEVESLDHLKVNTGQHGFLDKVAYAEPEIAALVAPLLLKYIAANPDISGAHLSKPFNVIGKALPNIVVEPAFVSLALDRFAASTVAADAANYLGFAMRVDPVASVAALSTKLDSLQFPDQKILAENVLPAVFGDRFMRGGVNPNVLPFDVLERLVRIAFKTIRHEDDIHHDGVYSPDTRDHAESARSTLFKQLYETPGRETLEALRRLEADPDKPIPDWRIEELIYDRASNDAEHAPWPAGEACALEQQFDTAPRTPKDLQEVAMSRLADIQDDLLHHRFAQGQTFKKLSPEREVQKWVARELELSQGRAFSLEREPHVVAEKEPDIRLQSRATDASLPIEIKVAESWTLTQLEDAVVKQLAGRYLLQRDHRHGVLVVAHQNARPQGWEDGTGAFLTFSEVLQRLRELAYRLGAGDDAQFVKVAAIDVSSVVIPEEMKEGKSKKRPAAKVPSKKGPSAPKHSKSTSRTRGQEGS